MKNFNKAKTLAVIMALLLTVTAVFFGCGDKGEEKKDDGTTAAAETTVAEEKTTKAEKETEADVDEEDFMGYDPAQITPDRSGL